MNRFIILKRLAQAGIIASLGFALFKGYYPEMEMFIYQPTCTTGISGITPVLSTSSLETAKKKNNLHITATIKEAVDDIGFTLQNPYYGYDDISKSRQEFVNTALSYEGKIPYVWGAKLSTADYYNPMTSGLDCSGFVQYIYYLSNDIVKESLGSTYIISSSYKPINMIELKPGDLGVIRAEGSYYTILDAYERFYKYDDALAYIESYNQHLRDISWEDVDYEEQVTEVVKEEVWVEVEDTDPVPETPSTPETPATPSTPETPATPEENTPSPVAEQNLENNGSEPESIQVQSSETPPAEEQPAETTTRTKMVKQIVEKTVTKTVIKTRRESTLDEDALLTEDDIELNSNHVGIFVGLDKDGNQIWCHCAGSAYGNTVVVGKYDNFKYFYKIIDD